ncbi:hypothetical protein ACE6H2_024210 [Prunus campanulata]
MEREKQCFVVSLSSVPLSSLTHLRFPRISPQHPPRVSRVFRSPLSDSFNLSPSLRFAR